MWFQTIFLVGFLWSRFCHLYYTNSRYPKPCLVYRNLCTYVLLVLIFSSQSERRKAILCLSLCLIDKSSFSIRSFTILDKLAQFCFMWVILDSEDSRKWIISSLNGLVHWNVGFQSLNTVIYDVVLNWPQNDDQDFMAAMEFDTS